MAKTKLISLYGLEPEFEERTPIDLSQINSKTFIIKLDRLNSAQQFKHVWDGSKELLKNVVDNIHYKKGFSTAKELAQSNMFPSKQNQNDNSLRNKTAQNFKPK